MVKLSQLDLPARFLMKKKDKNSGGNGNKNNCNIGVDEEKDPSIIRDRLQRKIFQWIELENTESNYGLEDNQVEAKDQHMGPSNNGLMRKPIPALSLPERVILFSTRSVIDAAAVKLQRAYRSYRTQRELADCAVLVEKLGWKALHFAALKQSSVPFFNIEKPESAVSPRARVGKGLSKDDKAQELALQHWLEAIDPRHRYGLNLHMYYDAWFDSESLEPFFYWLDIGEGREVNLEKCPRTVLRLRPNNGDEDNDSNGGGGGDDDNNGSSGGKNNKKGNDHDGDVDGNGDKDKRGGDDGGGEMKGKSMDFMGESLFGYKFGYHTGNKNQYPVGQLQSAHQVQSSEPKCLFYHAIIIIS